MAASKIYFDNLISVVLVTTIVVVSASEKYWTYEEYPNPIEQFKDCGRSGPSYVCDPDHILEDKQVDRLDNMIQELEKDTYCACESNTKCLNETNDGNSTSLGFRLGVAIAEKLPYSRSRLRRQRAAKTFVRNVRRQWVLGECGNDIIIFLVVDQQSIFISIGSTTDKWLNEGHLFQLKRRVKSYLKQKMFYEGISVAIVDLKDHLGNQIRFLAQSSIPTWISPFLGVAIVMTFCGCVVFALLARIKNISVSSKVSETEQTSEEFYKLQSY